MNPSTQNGKGKLPAAGTAGLARHLGVSRWTVSRVLNGHAGVKAATRERVLRAVEQYNFEPSLLARGLRGLPSGIVGISFPHLEAQVLARKSQVLQRELKEAGYRGLFSMPEGNALVEEEVVRHFLSIGVDGIVLLGSALEPGSDVLEEAKARGTNLVAVDSKHALEVPRVSLDRHRAMAMKLEHLHGLGHRRIAVLGLSGEDLYRGVRLRGLRQAARRLALNEGEELRYFDADGYPQQAYEYGAELARRVLKEPGPRPTALFCLNDRIAVGALQTLKDTGIGVPMEMSVIGFDNAPESAWIRPGLTTIDQNIEDLMSTAAELLWQGRIEGKALRRKVAPELILRGSTGPAPTFPQKRK